MPNPMNRDKQIEEMAMLVCRHTMTRMCADGTCPMLWECPLNIKTVEALHDAGYRKSTEVAREIFEEIARIGGTSYGDIRLNSWEIAELKKKYTEDTK